MLAVWYGAVLTDKETHHDSEAETEGAGQKSVALLYAKAGFARQTADNEVDTDDAGTEDASCGERASVA